MNTSPVDTLKALRGRVGVDVRGDVFLPCGRREPGDTANVDAALDTAIAALSDEQIRTVMRIEHEGRTFSVDGWAGPMVLGWRDAALSGGEAPVAVELTKCCGREECGGECGNEWRGMEWVRTTPRAVGDGMAVVPREIVENYCNSTMIPRHRRICEAVLTGGTDQGPHCEGHEGFDYDCIDCSDALERERRAEASRSEGSAQGEPVRNPDKLPASTGQVPEGVFYSGEHDNFYRLRDRAGMGTPFYVKWRPRAAEFPQAGAMDPEQRPASSQGDR